MTSLNGDKIKIKINSLLKNGLSIKQKTEGQNITYIINNKQDIIEVLINPIKWLGLKFHLLNINGKNQFYYSIDTDLYPISQPKYQEFANHIENDIVGFLDSLVNHKIKLGKVKGKQAMVIPVDNRFLLISKGLFFTSQAYFKNMQDIKQFCEAGSI